VRDVRSRRRRRIVKEALSLKFGGLEELGEKMCIIGELGKLLLEEIPLEETPPGYGRAPYTGFDKTENAVNEATKCVSGAAATRWFPSARASADAECTAFHGPVPGCVGRPETSGTASAHPSGTSSHSPAP
jgi:hypothetical protein